MLLSLLYHHIGKGKYANPLSIFEKQFEWLSTHYQTVLPGDPLQGKCVCLTFDDAYFDFYHFMFPLLKKYELRAVLAVPVAFIPDETSLSPKERLQKASKTKSPPLPSPAYCTWGELKTMQQSGLVHIASHSMTHLPLTAKQVDPQHELLISKKILEEKLGAPITTFVYPYGKFNTSIHDLAKQHYSYIMRIGNALNLTWKNSNQLFYRVNGDGLQDPLSPFKIQSRFRYFFRFLLNTCRKK